MKVLITGAGGNLGRAVVPALLEAGHSIRLMDFRPLEAPHEFIQGDVRSRADLVRAMEGVDAVVHAAALHGIHLPHWPRDDFWAINVTGTFNVYDAARDTGTRRVVLCSTMGVYGESARPPENAWAWVTDDAPTLPTDAYGMTKWLAEDIARYHARRWSITTVALRLGMFVPESWERYGFGLLFGGVDDRDVAQAAVLSLTHEPAGGFDSFNIFADVPFRPADMAALQQDPVSVLEQYYPGVRDTFAGLDLPDLIWGRSVWPPEKAQRLLGYRPRFNFAEFLAAYRAGNPGHYPFAGLPWWGVKS